MMCLHELEFERVDVVSVSDSDDVIVVVEGVKRDEKVSGSVIHRWHIHPD